MNKELEKYLQLIKDNNVVKLDPNNLSLGGFYQFLDREAHKYSTYLSVPARVQWEITQQCNLSCRQCYVNSKHFCWKDELDTKECLKLVEKLRRINVLWIELQGGEPLIRKDFLKIVEKIKLENLNVKIATNGTLITKEIAKTLFRLLDPKNDSFQISLDGSNAEINDRIRGKGAFEKTINGIKICKKIGLRYSINTTLMDENIHDAFNIYKLIHNIGGADRFSFFTLMKVGRGKQLNFALVEEGIRQFIKIKDFEKKVKKPSVRGYIGYEKHIPGYKETAEKVFGDKTIPVANRNSASISNMDIDCDGSVYPSSYLQIPEFNAGNVKSSTLRQLWNTPKWQDLRKESHKICGRCQICDLYNFCGGGTITNSYLHTKNFCSSDAQCLYEPVIKVDNIIIRRPKKEDSGFLKRLWGNPEVMKYVGFPQGMKVSDGKVAKWINEWQMSSQLRLIIEDSYKIVPIGEIGYREDNNFPFKHKGLVLALDIKIVPSYWGKGIAKKSLKKIIEKISLTNQYEFLQVTPNILNTKAVGLYKSLGFTEIGKTKSWVSKDGNIVNYQYMVLHK